MFASLFTTPRSGATRPNRRTRHSDTPARRALSARRLRLESLEDRQLLSVVSGQAFNDLNADGAKNAGESGQSGWTIYLDANTNGQFDTGETSTTTAADGSYSLNGLAAGTYTVAEVQQPGWQQTSPVGTAPAIERVSIASDGTQGNAGSGGSPMSADGRYVAINSSASNLVPGDTNGFPDAFVYDRQLDTIERVSVADDGTQGDNRSYGFSISADGRYVAIYSDASNLVPGDTNGAMDIFVYDREIDTIERVSVADDGTQGNGSSSYPTLSADGRYVGFSSNASNLVPGDTNGVGDSFVYDRETGSIERVSVAADGTQGNGTSYPPKLSADGRYVTYYSDASNLVTGDTNGWADVFIYDRQMETIERVSLAADGTQANSASASPSISANGRYVAFASSASNLVPGDTNGVGDVFVYDRQTHSIERVSIASDGTQGNAFSQESSLSADGHYVAFRSFASNLVPGDINGRSDIFVYDLQTHFVEGVTHASDGALGNGNSGSYCWVSGDGRYVGFGSDASNLVPGDTNGVSDAFVTANPFAWASGSHVVALADAQDVSGIDFGNTSLATKFYVVNDAALDRTYEYNATGTSVETYSLNTGNTAPRGAASTTAGDKTWVVDANRKVYVYNNSGGLLGSWTAGTLATNATVEGIATNGTDVWIVDAKSDKVYKYTGAATRLSGSQNAASNFNLNSGNTSPKDITTDGVNLWVVNDSTTDKVFKYTLSGSLVGSWTVSTSGATSPTGITVDPSNVSNIWIVDKGTKLVYQYNAAASRTSGSQAAAVSFALAAGNTNPQGIADPPVPDSMLSAIGTAAVSGQVFNDLNADGIKNAGEAGQSGWTIYLDADGNGQLTTGETSTTTAADGSYSFTGLAAGSYNVAEVQQLGWRQTSPAGTGPAVERVSVASDGMQGNGGSYSASISADNRYVAFSSAASNLVPGDTNGHPDIFVYDRQTDTTERVSVAADGTQGNDVSLNPSISADGRYVAFRSQASNLVPGADTNGYADVFVYDRQTYTIERVTLAADGTQAEGSFAGTSISADGRYVAFNSNASNLVPGDTNGQQDVFVYDRQTATTERVSVAADGTQGNGGTRFAPKISDDGRYVTFDSSASNLVPGDTNGLSDVFVYDRQTQSVERVSVASDSTQGNANSATTASSISADGRYVAFTSDASNLVPGDTNGNGDVFVYDRQTNTVERVNVASDGTQANGLSGTPSLSADGRYAAFSSAANNLVPGDANGWMDTFVYERQTHTTKLASLAPDGTQTSGGTSSGTISADGRFVAIYSTAGNLVPGDTNGSPDIFVTTTPFTWTSGSHVVVLAGSQNVSGMNFGNTSPTKFYVVNDATQNLTYEYNAARQSNESYSLNSGNTAPRGAASTTAGDKTWVVDANRKVYVYNTSGALLGSWTAGTLASNATVEGIATNGTDVWIVDAKSDKVYRYTGAASRLSGSQNAASSFSLNSANTSPKDIVTDGASLWVVNDSTTDKVFKYTTAGSLVISWTITTPGATSPTGITIDPANVCDVWIVDSGTDRVYQYIQGALTVATYSRSSATSFALAAGNTNPQGIADPPAPDSMVATEPLAPSAPVSQAMDAALLSLMDGQTKSGSAKTTSTVAAKPAVDVSFAPPSPRATTTASPSVASAQPRVSSAGRRGSAAGAVDHAITAFSGDDLKIESALQSLAGSRA